MTYRRCKRCKGISLLNQFNHEDGVAVFDQHCALCGHYAYKKFSEHSKLIEDQFNIDYEVVIDRTHHQLNNIYVIGEAL